MRITSINSLSLSRSYAVLCLALCTFAFFRFLFGEVVVSIHFCLYWSGADLFFWNCKQYKEALFCFEIWNRMKNVFKRIQHVMPCHLQWDLGSILCDIWYLNIVFLTLKIQLLLFTHLSEKYLSTWFDYQQSSL